MNDILLTVPEKNINEKALPKPKPVVSDGLKRNVKEYHDFEWFTKMREELGEAENETNEFRRALEVVDLLTVCVSYLNAQGFSREERALLYQLVNLKNEKRGYFKDHAKENAND